MCQMIPNWQITFCLHVCMNVSQDKGYNDTRLSSRCNWKLSRTCWQSFFALPYVLSHVLCAIAQKSVKVSKKWEIVTDGSWEHIIKNFFLRFFCKSYRDETDCNTVKDNALVVAWTWYFKIFQYGFNCAYW